MSLGGMGFDSTFDVTPPAVLLGLLLCYEGYLFLVGSNILLLTVVQQ